MMVVATCMLTLTGAPAHATERVSGSGRPTSCPARVHFRCDKRRIRRLRMEHDRVDALIQLPICQRWFGCGRSG